MIVYKYTNDRRTIFLNKNGSVCGENREKIKLEFIKIYKMHKQKKHSKHFYFILVKISDRKGKIILT